MLSNHRRTALIALVLAFGVASMGGCGNDDKPTKVLGEVIERSASPSPSTTAAPATSTTTAAPTTTVAADTPSTAPPATETPTTATPATEPPRPDPIIEIDYQVPDGSTATASIDGPGGHRDRAITNSVAVFDGLPEGAYDVLVSVNSPTPPTDGTGATLGPANSTARGRVEVHPGDHAVISCTGYADCQGLL